MTDDPHVAAVLAAFERLPALANADAWLVERGRFVDAECLVEIGPVPYRLAIAAGRVAALERAPGPMRSWRFAVRAAAGAWWRFWQPVPAPGAHDLLALAKAGHARIEGELWPLMANLQYFKDLLALPRGTLGGA